MPPSMMGGRLLDKAEESVYLKGLQPEYGQGYLWLTSSNMKRHFLCDAVEN